MGSDYYLNPPGKPYEPVSLSKQVLEMENTNKLYQQENVILHAEINKLRSRISELENTIRVMQGIK